MSRRSAWQGSISSCYAGPLGIALALLLIFANPRSAFAQSCTVTGPSLLLGTVNPYATASTTTSGTASYTCTNSTAANVAGNFCVSVGTGTGGTSTTNRTLLLNSITIPVQITAGGTSGQIGNGVSYPMYGPIFYFIQANSRTSGTFPLAVTMPPPSPPPPGSYTSSFAGTDAQFLYNAVSSTTSCSNLSSSAHLTTQGNFSISATIATQCKVSSGSMAFPIRSFLTNVVNAAATISITCNAATPVTIALDNGATGTGPTARQMKSGSNVITYGIYRDAGATLPWGNTSGTNIASFGGGTGTVTAYGVVPAQASPPPGSYSDVVNVTISY